MDKSSQTNVFLVHFMKHLHIYFGMKRRFSRILQEHFAKIQKRRGMEMLAINTPSNTQIRLQLIRFLSSKNAHCKPKSYLFKHLWNYFNIVCFLHRFVFQSDILYGQSDKNFDRIRQLVLQPFHIQGIHFKWHEFCKKTLIIRRKKQNRNKNHVGGE